MLVRKVAGLMIGTEVCTSIYTVGYELGKPWKSGKTTAGIPPKKTGFFQEPLGNLVWNEFSKRLEMFFRQSMPEIRALP